MRPSRRAFTLLESVIGLGIFVLLLIVLATMMTGGTALWRDLESSADANLNLRNLAVRLRQDLARTSFQELATTTVPGGGAHHGDAVWFLSAVDPATGEFMRKSDGTPFWQRNLLYYSVVPNGHSELYGYACAGGADSDGYDDRCPHKMLICKQIDSGVPTVITDETSQESLIPAGQIANYLTAPDGFDVSGMSGEPGLELTQVVARALVTFRVFPAPGSWGNEVRVDARAVQIRSAEKSVAIGQSPLGEGKFTTQLEFSVAPENP
ncbi:MAG: type II secretion system protein [Armatimonadetes bacterium]|nr:type II secretion system protein [Armatimonadota bacterium]